MELWYRSEQEEFYEDFLEPGLTYSRELVEWFQNMEILNLDKLLDQLRPGDTLVVWRLDRLGRSIRHLIDQLARLQERGVEFRSLQENIDTQSSGGRLVFHIFASLAEFERDLIRERTNAGLEAARARGRVGAGHYCGRGTSCAPRGNSTNRRA